MQDNHKNEIIQQQFFDADFFQQVKMVPANKKWYRIQQTVHYVKTRRYAESVKDEDKSGIRKLVAKLHLEGESLQC